MFDIYCSVPLSVSLALAEGHEVIILQNLFG